jgi:hypothetical protein
MICFSLRIFRTLTIAVSATLLFSCSGKQESASVGIDSLSTVADPSSTATDTSTLIGLRFSRIDAYLQSEPVNGDEEEWFESDCALLIHPTEDQIDAMIKEYGEEDFHIIADDNVWYHSSAGVLLDSVGVRVLTPTKRFVKLAGEDSSWRLDLRRRGAFPWNLILFSTKKGPQIFSTVDLSAEEIRAYFDLKPFPDYAIEKFRKVSTTYSLGDGLSQQFLEADFSGDKKTDIAIFVEQEHDDKKGILFFFDGSDDPIVVGAGKELGDAGDDFKWAGRWEVIDAKSTEETTFSTDGDVSGSREVILERPAISIRELEGSGGLIYYNGKTFEWIHQGD